ncbi:MAG: recombinase family protein [Lachnospiraceae bacterium]|nr:recombinase family protein [Lachnospiraceae bacterium]
MFFAEQEMDEITTIGTVAVYARISKTDKRCPEQNQSISNQIQLILEYIRQDSQLSDMKIQIFQDEGYTGTNMERPAVRKLLANIYLGRIQALVVKDFSRLSRNHIQLSELRENTFLRYPVIFISIGDYYDSRKKETMELGAGFRSVFYEYYSRDVSRKVKKTLESRKENGEYAVANAPYGYRKASSGGFEIEPVQAEQIKMIFILAREGWNTAQIARRLNEIRGQEKPFTEGPGEWHTSQVWRIINNPVYMGYQVWHKYENKYQNGFYRKNVQREEWKKQEGRHPAIISENLYEQVQRQQHRTGAYGKKKGKRHVFHGVTKCGFCGRALCRHRQKREMLCCREIHHGQQTMISEHLLWESCLALWKRSVHKTGVTEEKKWEEWEKELFLKEFVQRIFVEGEDVVWLQWKVAGKI